MVSKQLDESLADVQRIVAEKLARARDDFQLRYSALNPNELKALVNVIESGNQINMEKYRDELVMCPACEHMGVTSGDYDLDWDVDYDRDGSIMGGHITVQVLEGLRVRRF
jgi:hypothetical protein